MCFKIIFNHIEESLGTEVVKILHVFFIRTKNIRT